MTKRNQETSEKGSELPSDEAIQNRQNATKTVKN